MKTPLILIAAFTVFHPTIASAAPATTTTVPSYADCGTLVVDRPMRITLPAHPQVATHVQFPGPLSDVSNSAPALWDDFTAPTGGQALWVRPRTTTTAGSIVGVTALSQDGRPYNFQFEITSIVPKTTCWTIVDHRPAPGTVDALTALEAQRQALELQQRRLRIERQDAARRLADLEAERRTEIASLSRTAARQARDAVEAFKYGVTTAYEWSYNPTPPPFQISAAFDDGRNTYVRILSDAYGAPAIVGVSDDSPVVLNYTYDDLTGVYTIQGIHHILELRFAGALARVTRQQ